MLTISINSQQRPIPLGNDLGKDKVWKGMDLTKRKELESNDFLTLLQGIEWVWDLDITPDLQKKMKKDVISNKRGEYNINDCDGGFEHHIIIQELEATD